jgi:hypothetical protein
MESSFPVSNFQIILSRGWIFLALLALILSFFFFHFRWQQQEIQALNRHKSETLDEIDQLKNKIIYYQMALQSLDDPDWIEKQMIEKLGVVPKGYQAIYFKGDS